MTKEYKFLKDINFPSDLRKLSENNLQELSDEVRTEMINAVSETGGHLGAGLGVVELTVALPFFLSFPVIFPAILEEPLKSIISSAI